MIYYFIILAYFFVQGNCIAQEPPYELLPVDAGIEDRGVLQSSFFVETKDLRQNQNFERLYKVAGSTDIYVRQAGGLRAIFRSSAYAPINNTEVPIVPAGTVYCIGEIRPELLQHLGHLQKEPEARLLQVNNSAQAPTAITQQPGIRRTIRFIDDIAYRRKRLAGLVLFAAMKGN